MNPHIKDICDSADISSLERMKQYFTMNQIDAMVEYMESKRVPHDQSEWYEEDELLIATCIKIVSEYHIVRFLQYLKKIR
jgi:hypothetical protein